MTQTIIFIGDGLSTTEIFKNELRKALMTMKPNKAPGFD